MKIRRSHFDNGFVIIKSYCNVEEELNINMNMSEVKNIKNQIKSVGGTVHIIARDLKFSIFIY